MTDIKTEWNRTCYQTNLEPKIGDRVRCSRNMQDNEDYLYEVTSVDGGRMGNKVGIKMTHQDGVPLNPNESFWTEYYYYCMCPQA